MSNINEVESLEARLEAACSRIASCEDLIERNYHIADKWLCEQDEKISALSSSVVGVENDVHATKQDAESVREHVDVFNARIGNVEADTREKLYAIVVELLAQPNAANLIADALTKKVLVTRQATREEQSRALVVRQATRDELR